MQSGATGLAPPGTWSLADGSLMSSDSAEPSRGDARDASAAWKHCRNVARDEGRTPDLYDLLSHSVRETQYSFPPHGVSHSSLTVLHKLFLEITKRCDVFLNWDRCMMPCKA